MYYVVVTSSVVCVIRKAENDSEQCTHVAALSDGPLSAARLRGGSAGAMTGADADLWSWPAGPRRRRDAAAVSWSSGESPREEAILEKVWRLSGWLEGPPLEHSRDERMSSKRARLGPTLCRGSRTVYSTLQRLLQCEPLAALVCTPPPYTHMPQAGGEGCKLVLSMKV